MKISWYNNLFQSSTGPGKHVCKQSRSGLEWASPLIFDNVEISKTSICLFFPSSTTVYFDEISRNDYHWFFSSCLPSTMRQTWQINAIHIHFLDPRVLKGFLEVSCTLNRSHGRRVCFWSIPFGATLHSYLNSRKSLWWIFQRPLIAHLRMH